MRINSNEHERCLLGVENILQLSCDDNCIIYEFTKTTELCNSRLQMWDFMICKLYPKKPLEKRSAMRGQKIRLAHPTVK